MKERIMFCETCGNIIDPHDRKSHLDHDLIVHPTQKPKELTERLIKSCRPDGEFRVLVPFCGSGSECLCARKFGGKYLSFELNEKYAKMAEANVDFHLNNTTTRKENENHDSE